MSSVLKKLGYKGQDKVLVLNPPEEFQPILDALQGGVDREARGTYSFIFFFARQSNEAQVGIKPALEALNFDGHLWFCYPKGTSKRYKSDLKRDDTWALFEPYGFRPVSQVSIDDDWSALRFRDVNLVKK